LYCQATVGIESLRVSAFRCICAKFAIFLDIIDKRREWLMEDHVHLLVVFRKDRSTKRQLRELQSLWVDQRKAKSLSIMLFLYIKKLLMPCITEQFFTS
jgi:hypothetical protein